MLLPEHNNVLLFNSDHIKKKMICIVLLLKAIFGSEEGKIGTAR